MPACLIYKIFLEPRGDQTLQYPTKKEDIWVKVKTKLEFTVIDYFI